MLFQVGNDRGREQGGASSQYLDKSPAARVLRKIRTPDQMDRR